MSSPQTTIDEAREIDALEKKDRIYFNLQKDLLKLANPDVTDEEVWAWIERKDSRLRFA